MKASRSFHHLVCRRVAVEKWSWRLIDPVITRDFHQISRRGKPMPPGADDFAAFLKAYIARWAARAGVL
jgi:hypothetical protein